MVSHHFVIFVARGSSSSLMMAVVVSYADRRRLDGTAASLLLVRSMVALLSLWSPFELG